MSIQQASDLELLVHHAKTAGDIAMRYFESDNEVWMKDGNSPVSQADMAVDKYLQEALTSARPNYGWLSEETEDDKTRLDKERIFVVDPIDGTRGFISGSPEWCVSLAVVEKGRPIAGVLNCPALGLVFTASEAEKTKLNGEQISVRQSAAIENATGSKKVSTMLSDVDGLEVIGPIPSLAYRIALVANATVDAVFAHEGAHDWDLAAADIIVANAGGFLCDESGKQLNYNCSSPRHGALIAGAVNKQESTLRLAKSSGIIQ